MTPVFILFDLTFTGYTFMKNHKFKKTVNKLVVVVVISS